MGDSGPRVVLLQVLLNRHGGGLTVDGIFGTRTRQAVSDARERLLGGPGPAADPDLWRALFDEQSLCGIDAFDMGEERFVEGTRIVAQAGSRVVETGAMCNGVEAVVQGIRARSAPPGSLAALRTWGHGNRGHWLSFTVGEVVETTIEHPALGAAIAAERRSYIDPDNFDTMSPVLMPVRRCFATVGIYEHHGCSLGRIPATRRMMGRLARLWGVPVTVAVGTQRIPFTAATALRFQGQTFTAYPGGTLRSWIAQVLAGESARR
jgi:hypothetical protein